MKFDLFILVAFSFYVSRGAHSVIQTNKNPDKIPEYGPVSWATGYTVSSMTFPDQGTNCVIDKVRVDVNLVHTWTQDLILHLWTRDNNNKWKRVQLISQQGGNCDNMHVIFTDSSINDAQLAVCDNVPPIGIEGDFSPDEPLGSYIGLTMNLKRRFWLYIHDVVVFDRGELLSWTLDIDVECGCDTLMEKTVFSLPMLIAAQTDEIIAACSVVFPKYSDAGGDAALVNSEIKSDNIDKHTVSTTDCTKSSNLVWNTATILGFVIMGIIIIAVSICGVYQYSAKKKYMQQLGAVKGKLNPMEFQAIDSTNVLENE